VAAAWRVKDALGLNPVLQRYYPQCRPCSFRQATAVRTGARTLQLHAGGSRPWYYSGTLVGLRHYADPARVGPAGGAGRGGRFAGGAGRAATRGSGPFAGIDLDKSALDDLAAAIGRMQAAAASALMFFYPFFFIAKHMCSSTTHTPSSCSRLPLSFPLSSPYECRCGGGGDSPVSRSNSHLELLPFI
jgi:hypothetical protein